jgi:hypothetical protein
MYPYQLLRNLFALVLIFLATSTCIGSPWGTYDPVGTWVYSAPGVPEEYTNGEMVIAEGENGYLVIVALDEYNRLEAEEVKIEDTFLKFTLYVESELVTVSGNFDGDTFTGTVSYSDGIFDFSATRMKQDTEE